MFVVVVVVVVVVVIVSETALYVCASPLHIRVQRSKAN